MPRTIDDGVTSRLVAELARRRGVSEEDAVRLAVQAELDRTLSEAPLRERFAALRSARQLPPETGLSADKTFLDRLSGDDAWSSWTRPR